MRKNNAKPLFGLSDNEPVKRKRGRPRKTEQTQTKKESVKNVEKPKEKTKNVRQYIKEELNPDDVGWKDFTKSKPELLQPVEFYVNTGKKKKDIFRGYVKTPGETITDEPYKLVVLRKRYNNLYYREIDGCENVLQCPKEFPFCDNCSKRKSK